MGYIVKMPKLGLEMERGTVVEWRVGEGEEIGEGDVVAEIESEKSIGEVDAREDGVLRRVYAEEGETVPPGTPIGIVAAPDADVSDLEAEVEAEVEVEAEADVEAEVEADAADARPRGTAGTAPTGESGGADDSAASTDVKASPRAKRRAEELDVDLTAVEGSGPQGAITEDDVEAAAEPAEAAAEEVKASPRAKKRAEELNVDLATVDGTGPQGSITEEDVEAVAEARAEAGAVDEPEPELERIVPERPELTRYERATAVIGPEATDALLDATAAARNAFDEDVSVTDVLMVAVSATLANRSEFNATFREGTHQLLEARHVALVTDVEGDLLAPVVPNVEDRSLAELAEYQPEEGGPDPTFTVANVAELDECEVSDALVNRPGVACLAVDPSGQRAVPGEGGVDLRPLVTAGLIYDTRAVDRRDAERFLDALSENLERSSELLLDTFRA